MFDLCNIDFSGLYYSEELKTTGIQSTNDLIKPAITSLLKNGIQEHIRACNLGKEACDELLKALEGDGFEVRLDQEVYPDISFLPTSFSNAEPESTEGDDGFIKYDKEHQRALNYASWLPTRMLADKAEAKSVNSEGSSVPYPLNLLNAVFGERHNYRSDFLALCASIQESLDDVLDTLTPEEKRVIELIYKDGTSVDDIICALDLQNHQVALWAVNKSIEEKGAKALRKLRHPARCRRFRYYLDVISYLDSVEGVSFDDVKKSFLHEQSLAWTTDQGEAREMVWRNVKYTIGFEKMLNTDEFLSKLIYYTDEFDWCSWPAGLLTGTALPVSQSGIRYVIEKAYFSTNPAFGHYLLAIGHRDDGEDFYGLFEVDGGELHSIQVDAAILKNLHQTIEKEIRPTPKDEALHALYRAEQQFCRARAEGMSDPKEKSFYQTFLELIQERLDSLPKSRVKYYGQISIDEMGLSVRAYNCLKRANINTLDDLASKTEDEMMKVRNLGRNSLEEVIQKMEEYGVSFSLD